MSTLSNRSLVISAPKGYLPTEAEVSAEYRESFAKLARYFDRLAGGMEPGAPGENVIFFSEGATDAAAVKASGTVTTTGVAGPTGTVTVGGKDITFDTTGGDNADAAAFAAAVDADAEVSEVVSTSVVNNIVTLTAKLPGVLGNLISLRSATAGVALSGTRLSGGVGGSAPVTVSF